MRAAVIATLIHVPLGILAYRLWPIAALQAAAALSVGLTAAYRKRVATVAEACAYIAGSEVLWRMARAPMPYEFGKYAIALICAVGVLRVWRRGQSPWLPIGYVLALLPATFALLVDPGVTTTRVTDALRFYLSGPFALAASAMLFQGQQLKRVTVTRCLTTVAIATVSVASVVVYSTITTVHLRFVDDSNFATSGGFGPNQVSTALGLGALCSLLVALTPRSSGVLRILCLGLSVAFAGCALITFSRGGLYGAVGAIACALPFLLRRRETRRTLVVVALMLGVGGVAIVWPRLNRFTGGMLGQRFADTNPTGRDVLIRDDLLMFARNPLVGVGPGMSSKHRALIDYGIGHTEYSRMLAEHGIGGAVSLLLLAIMTLNALQRSKGKEGKGIQVALISWSLMSMLHVAMRLAMMSYVYGLATAEVGADEERPTSQ